MKAFNRFSLFLTPSILQGAVSLLMLPLATRVLGPADYGIFALASAYTGLGTALASLGIGYVLAERLRADGGGTPAEVVSTCSILALAAIVAYAAVLAAVWPFLPGVEHVPASCLWLAIAAMIAGQLWLIAIDVLVIRGDAKPFAIISVAQTLLSAAALAVALFALDLGTSALFAAHFCGALVALVGSLIALRPYWRPRLDRSVMKELRALGLMSGAGSSFEALQTVVERGALSLAGGIVQLGIYTHSHQYRTLASLPVKALARSIWPVTLREARDRSSRLGHTRLGWDLAYIGLTFSGVLFATLGDRLIAFITNGKFTDAFTLATCWMIYLLLLHTGKPQTGVLYALGGGRKYATIVALSAAAGTAAMLVLIPYFGVWGAVAAAVLQQVTVRLGIQAAARPVRQVPFQDGWAYFGMFYVAATLAARLLFAHSLVQSLATLLVAWTVLLAIVWAPLRRAVHRIRSGALAGS